MGNFQEGNVVFPRNPMPVLSVATRGRVSKISTNKPFIIKQVRAGGVNKTGLLEFEGKCGVFDSVFFVHTGI